MFDLVKSLIGYNGSSFNNIDSYVVYTCMILIVLGVTVTIDMIYKLFLRFLPRDSK